MFVFNPAKTIQKAFLRHLSVVILTFVFPFTALSHHQHPGQGRTMVELGASPQEIFQFLERVILGDGEIQAEYQAMDMGGEYALNIDRRASMGPFEGDPAVAAIIGSNYFQDSQTPLTFAMAITHEFGHLLAFGPKEPIGFREPKFLIASEGASDYQSGRLLLKAYETEPKTFEKLILQENNMDVEFVEKARKVVIAAVNLNENEMSEAEKKKLAILSKIVIGGYFLLLNSEGYTHTSHGSDRDDRFTTPEERDRLKLTERDPTIVLHTLFEYPSLRSRMDSIIAGALGLPRPRSWANPRDFKDHKPRGPQVLFPSLRGAAGSCRRVFF